MKKEECEKFCADNFIEDNFGLWEFIEKWGANATLEMDEKQRIVIRLIPFDE